MGFLRALFPSLAMIVLIAALVAAILAILFNLD